MGEVTSEQVNLMLRLYEERREPKLREARDWFSANFHVKTADDSMRVCPPGSKENTYMRMVLGYWEMVASIVNRGLIDEEFFFESNGETRAGCVARDVQQPKLPRQPGKTMQPPGSVAREAQPRVQRSHSQSARANATGEPSSQGASRGRLALRLEVRSTLGERPGNAGVCWAKHRLAPAFTE